jgi:hypothetical protein
MESASSSCASVSGLRARTPLPPPIPRWVSPGGTRRSGLGHAVLGRALAVHADLAGACPAADGGKAHLRQVALEPAVKPDVVVVAPTVNWRTV